MTTTLRPAQPGDRLPGDAPDGEPYAICANGQPVGGLALVETPGGLADAWIAHLSVDPAYRRRGHGSVAVLAAEEVLRGRGCHRAGIRLPDDPASAGVAAALGYTERSRNMVKSLAADPDAVSEPDGGPDASAGVTLRDLTDAELPGWLAEERELAAGLRADAGVRRADAEAEAETSLRALLPDGLATAGTTVRVAVRDGAVAGSLWVRTGPQTPAGVDGWVYSVRVAPARRRSGVGRALMTEAERVSRAAGAATLGLHVLADNPAALALYRSLGYQTTQVNSVKVLG